MTTTTMAGTSIARRAVKLVCVLAAIAMIAAFPVVVAAAAADESNDTAGSSEKKPKAKDDFDPKAHTDWGGYYDPQNIFCGKYDCYRILGFDYEKYDGKNLPDTKLITKRYRALSREWHPDKSKHKDAKERFVKIARAYEVLTDKEKRKEYDFMRYNQEAYFQKYGAGVLWSYAPKSDVTVILIVLFAAAHVFVWMAQKHRWQLVADRLVQAAVEDWSPSQGGTPESKQLREDAKKELEESKKAAANGDSASRSADASTSKSKKEKISGKDKKKAEQDLLRPIIQDKVYAIDDFGAGFHKPTWKDILIVKLVQLPITLASGTAWQMGYAIRRLQGKELNDNEREVLTARAVGNVTWDLASDEEREELIKRELWIKENLVDFKEEEEVKTWSKAEQKQYYKMKKKGIKME